MKVAFLCLFALLILCAFPSSFSLPLQQSRGLYGLSSAAQLLRIDPKTATQTPIGSPISNEYDAEELSSIDSVNGIYYLIGFNSTSAVISLIGVDLQTAKIRYNIILPFVSSAFVGVGETCDVDPSTGDVFVTGRESASGKHHILRVTPSTGKIQFIAELGNIDVLGGPSAFDPVNKIYWLQYGLNTTYEIYLFGFNVLNGKLVYQLDDVLNMETMDYDPVTGLIFGIGLKVISDTDYYRVLMTLNSKDGSFNVIAKIPNYYIINGSLGTIDPVSRTYYCILQPSSSDTAPMDLMTIDLKTANIISNPQICDSSLNGCPWALNFYSP